MMYLLFKRGVPFWHFVAQFQGTGGRGKEKKKKREMDMGFSPFL